MKNRLAVLAAILSLQTPVCASQKGRVPSVPKLSLPAAVTAPAAVPAGSLSPSGTLAATAIPAAAPPAAPSVGSEPFQKQLSRLAERATAQSEAAADPGRPAAEGAARGHALFSGQAALSTPNETTLGLSAEPAPRRSGLSAPTPRLMTSAAGPAERLSVAERALGASLYEDVRAEAARWSAEPITGWNPLTWRKWLSRGGYLPAHSPYNPRYNQDLAESLRAKWINKKMSAVESRGDVNAALDLLRERRWELGWLESFGAGRAQTNAIIRKLKVRDAELRSGLAQALESPAVQPEAWRFRTAASGTRDENALEEIKTLWREQVEPWLVAHNENHKTTEFFKALLHAGDYSFLRNRVAITQDLVRRESGPLARLLGRTPAAALARIQSLAARPDAETVAQASAPERFATRDLYFEFLRWSVRDGRISGYYARLRIGMLDDYSQDPAAIDEAMSYPASFFAP